MLRQNTRKRETGQESVGDATVVSVGVVILLAKHDVVYEILLRLHRSPNRKPDSSPRNG